MKISLANIGKRYNRGWIFKDLSCELSSGQAMAILGSNGSGKSTLLKMISGILTPSKGDREYISDGDPIPEEDVYRNVSISAPYLELLDEYTLEEQISFHFKFKEPMAGIEINAIPEVLGLEKEKDRAIQDYSSGMQQRVKLGLAILSDTPILLLDEPASNLDAAGVSWFNELLDKYGRDKLVVICSNSRAEEYQFCSEEMIMENYG